MFKRLSGLAVFFIGIEIKKVPQKEGLIFGKLLEGKVIIIFPAVLLQLMQSIYCRFCTVFISFDNSLVVIVIYINPITIDFFTIFF